MMPNYRISCIKMEQFEVISHNLQNYMHNYFYTSIYFCTGTLHVTRILGLGQIRVKRIRVIGGLFISKYIGDKFAYSNIWCI